MATNSSKSSGCNKSVRSRCSKALIIISVLSVDNKFCQSTCNKFVHRNRHKKLSQSMRAHPDIKISTQLITVLKEILFYAGVV